MSNVQDILPKLPVVNLGGRERTLKFTLNGLAELEDLYGSVETAFEKLEKNKSIKVMRDVLWCGLIWAEPTLTRQEVGNMIDLSNMAEIMESLGAAFAGSMPTPVASEGEQSPNP